MRHKRGEGSVVGVKVDMMKAYDRVDWRFLLKVLECFGFSKKWCNLINQCITIVKFSVLVNGSPFGFFSPSRGLRQGDPLSPYLFILCTEVLSRLLLRREGEGKLHGVSVGHGCPPISHLMFADDLMLFCRATATEVEALKDCLEPYKRWSGQCMNRGKSYIFGSRNASKERLDDLGTLMGVSRAPDTFDCLGHKLTIRGRHSGAFDGVVDKIKTRLAGWRAKALSWAGRATLIRVVFQSIPIYTMCTELAPAQVCQSLDSIARKFWWRVDQGKSHFLALKSWESLCKPKRLGGLGFRNFSDMNKSLVAKLGWSILTKPSSPWAKLLINKYGRRANWLEGNCDSRGSPTWKGIVKSRDVLTRAGGLLSNRGWADCQCLDRSVGSLVHW